MFTRGWAEKLGLRSINLNRRVPRMNVHKNARLNPSGRALLAERIEAGWTTQPKVLMTQAWELWQIRPDWPGPLAPRGATAR